MENVTVTDHGSQLDSTNLALSWDHDGARWHVWEQDPSVLYKNPPLGVGRRKAGWFATRELDATNKVNAALIRKAREIAVQAGLYEKAAEDKRQKAEAEAVERQRLIILHQHKEAAEELYAACKLALSGTTNPAIEPVLRAALEKADGHAARS